MCSEVDIPDYMELKNTGNTHFKLERYSDALECYTKAADSSKEGDAKLQAILYSNMAACHLKLHSPEDARKQASKALEKNPNEVKALFRRCQALELLGRKEEALADALKLISIDSKNKAIVPFLHRLSADAQQKKRKQDSTDFRVTEMLDIVFADGTTLEQPNSSEKREQALSNLLVLARDDAGADKICKARGVSKLKTLLIQSVSTFRINAIRVLACLAKHSAARAEEIMETVGLRTLVIQFGEANEELCNAASSLIQSLIEGMTNLQQFREAKAKHEIHKEKTGTPHGSKFKPLHLSDDQHLFIDELFGYLTKCINSGKMSAHGRDSILQLIMRNVTSSDGLNWTRKFLETDGSVRLMEVAGMVPARSTIPVSTNTRMHCSALMSKIWDDTISDQQRDKIRALTDEYFVEQFADSSFDSKLDAVVALSSLLQGPTELGNSVLGKAGVMQMLLALAESSEISHQLIAVEALVHATSKKEKCVGIVDTAIPILKKLFKESPNDGIRVRSLVGMCKISSSSGSDAADKTISDDSQLTLSRLCRKFLANKEQNNDLRKWAVEGLAYLTLDAEVKEELVADREAVRALVDVAKTGDQTVMFPVASTLVNLMNAYDKPEIMPEMKQLAEYAKQKIPEEHPKDKEECVTKRVDALVSYEVGSAVVALAALVTDSPQCKELLSRIFLAIVTDDKRRGKLVQQGGGKVLLTLALDNSPVGKQLASQALAKLSISINPEVAFPGQRIVEVVRPLLRLLHPDRSALQNFESLMALTNIASVSESARRKVVAEKGVSDVESYMVDDHEMLKRAATECMCNLLLDDEVVNTYMEDNDKCKLLFLYCGDDDSAVQRAACGGLAILSSQHPDKLAAKLMQISSWKDLLLQALVSEEDGMRHRATHLMANLMESSKELSTAIVSSQLFDILMAISKVDGEQHRSAKECALAALEATVTHKLVKANSTSGS